MPGVKSWWTRELTHGEALVALFFFQFHVHVGSGNGMENPQMRRTLRYAFQKQQALHHDFTRLAQEAFQQTMHDAGFSQLCAIE